MSIDTPPIFCLTARKEEAMLRKTFLLHTARVEEGVTIRGGEEIDKFLLQDGVTMYHVAQSYDSSVDQHVLTIFYTQNTPTNYREPPIRG
jgi:hypothetical protein